MCLHAWALGFRHAAAQALDGSPPFPGGLPSVFLTHTVLACLGPACCVSFVDVTKKHRCSPGTHGCARSCARPRATSFFKASAPFRIWGDVKMSALHTRPEKLVFETDLCLCLTRRLLHARSHERFLEAACVCTPGPSAFVMLRPRPWTAVRLFRGKADCHRCFLTPCACLPGPWASRVSFIDVAKKHRCSPGTHGCARSCARPRATSVC